MSRTSSANTVHHFPKPSPPANQRPGSESPLDAARTVRSRESSHRKSSEATATTKPRLASLERYRSPSSNAEENDPSSSSSSDSEVSAPMSRSRTYMRRPRYSNNTNKAPLGPLSDADEDENDDNDEDDDSPAFLPFADSKAAAAPPPSDPSATLRMAKQSLAKKPQTAIPLHSSSSSTQSQSQSQPQRSSSSSSHHPSRGGAPMSPHRRGGGGSSGGGGGGSSKEPASALSPRQRRIVKEGSDGSPSMGSSFSDLDDASVTQSALEEALANEMNHGSMASRMSTISQALRSRYL
ncbi:MAG: hypothetical protein Q9190_007161 [Brigantiaea leucoxantha]